MRLAILDRVKHNTSRPFHLTGITVAIGICLAILSDSESAKDCRSRLFFGSNKCTAPAGRQYQSLHVLAQESSKSSISSSHAGSPKTRPQSYTLQQRTAANIALFGWLPTTRGHSDLETFSQSPPEFHQSFLWLHPTQE